MVCLDRIMDLSPVIPVLVIDKLDHAVPLAAALYRGGIRALELTLRTECSLQAIADIKQAIPGMVVGAGTVVTAADVTNAAKVGAEFLVSPGSTPSLVRRAFSEEIPLLPGVSTPSEAMVLLEQGFYQLKFFPAEAAGGVSMLKSIFGPLPRLRFFPTGGINFQNASSYLALPNVTCIGGSWMIDREAIASKDWDTIERLSSEAIKLF